MTKKARRMVFFTGPVNAQKVAPATNTPVMWSQRAKTACDHLTHGYLTANPFT